MFYKNYIVYYNVYCYYCGVFIEKYVCTKFHLNWLLCHGHLCAHCNVWPEAFYCYFTRTTLFIKLFTCLYDQLEFAITSPSFVTLYHLVSEIVKCIA